ncbi:hypothetical protein [Amycolatopsis sp. lyj-109]|uniref:hypothetical protein n=1 Tax=Amycolatopsis sp. lyj-109 TaxID=2789287 RepID=UPI0039799C79
MTNPDEVVLQQVRELWTAVDPPPPLLADWVLFALEPTTADVEIFRAGGRRELAGARGEECTRSITFSGTRRTVVLTLTPSTEDTVRVDGWIAPPGALPVELRTGKRLLSTTSDERGRFAFDQVEHGQVQLVVRDDGTTLTPAIVL